MSSARSCVVFLFAAMLVSAKSSPQLVTNADSSAIDIAELKKNAEAGDPKAQYALGTAYEDGNGVPQNDELAAQWYRKAADQGDAAAQNALGVLYRLGRGVEKDKQEALRWCQRAAQQGYASAMFNIGGAYYNGDGVPANDEIACAWFLLAQDAGSKAGADAVKRSVSEHSPHWILEIKFRVAIMLEAGDGIKADPAAAMARYRELAAGDPKVSRVPEEAHLRMAQMYLGGHGLARDVNSVRQECEAAASLRSGRGCYCLGMLNERGDLGSPNYTEALRWYRSAVRYGDDRAMLRLGKFYESGQGVKHDDVEALKWYLLALDHRQADAKAEVDILRSRLTKKENEKALREAREWNRWQ